MVTQNINDLGTLRVRRYEKRGIPAEIRHTVSQIVPICSRSEEGTEIALYESEHRCHPRGAVLCCGIWCVGSMLKPCNNHAGVYAPSMS